MLIEIIAADDGDASVGMPPTCLKFDLSDFDLDLHEDQREDIREAFGNFFEAVTGERPREVLFSDEVGVFE